MSQFYRCSVFFFCTIEDKVSREVEPNAPLPTEKLAAMKELSQEGVAVTCRWQPFIKVLPGNNGEFVDAVHQAGAMHLSFEHLKIGFWREIISKKSTILLSALEDYHRRGRVRDGWEWVLASECKVDDLVQVREFCHRLGMSFGAADNEFIYLSDHFACCSAIDQFPAFGNFYRYQTSYALKKAIGSEIRFSEIGSRMATGGIG